jgi:hypothetical protein
MNSKILIVILIGLIACAETSAQEKPVIERLPVAQQGVSTSRAMIFDLFPGGGHFYLENSGNGIMFALLKTGGAAASFYFYRDWKSKQKNENTGADSKKASDRAAQKFTFSILGGIAVHIISWSVVYSDCQEINRSARPVFEISSIDPLFSSTRCSVRAGMSFNF